MQRKRPESPPQTRPQITLDGMDVSSLSLQWYRSHVALVSQEPIIFTGTVRENVRGVVLWQGVRGRGCTKSPPATPRHCHLPPRNKNQNDPSDSLWQTRLFRRRRPGGRSVGQRPGIYSGAARGHGHAGAEGECGLQGGPAAFHSVVASPHALFHPHSQVGPNPGAVQLSGGQRQRIAIARVFLQASPVILLDEATSALDAASEAKVTAALAGLMAGRTTVIVAHRLATVRGASAIAVVDGGRVVEQGGHDQLLAAKGAYHELVESQLL